MAANNFDAYVVPTDDNHQSEYVSAYDERRRFISGLSGSAGTAVVLVNVTALWVDGRYFLQAETEVDCSWLLMRRGQAGVPTITDWLIKNFQTKANATIAADSDFMSADTWNAFDTKLKANGMRLVDGQGILDDVWNSYIDFRKRPEPTNNAVFVLDTIFCGRTWQDKVADLQTKLNKEDKADILVITDLSEVAWLFNLRGSDVNYSPFFFAYAIVPKSGNPKLYLRDQTNRIGKISGHLWCDMTGRCRGINSSMCTEVLPYPQVFADLYNFGKVLSKIWISKFSSYKIYSQVPLSKIVNDPSPLQILKAVKNSIEQQGMRKSHIRDSAAIIEFVAILEKEVRSGKDWDELKVVKTLESYRRKQEYYEGGSFKTIAGFGPNGALPHYNPSNGTNLKVTTSSMLVLDSGGQYRDGTTDITRTFHFGMPTDFQKEAYTRVLMGAIDLAKLIWPANATFGASLDAVARAPLWSVGLDYRHGTGHGLGMFLSVHEGPARISRGFSSSDDDSPIYEGMFLSDEPGYYQDGEFGVRLETIVMATKANTNHKFDGSYLTFEPIALVPFEPKLIKLDLLDLNQKKWLNRYHALCQEKVGKYLLSRNLSSAHDWLTRRSAAIPLTCNNANGHRSMFSATRNILYALLATVCRSIQSH